MKNLNSFKILAAILAMFFAYGTTDVLAQRRVVKRKPVIKRTIVKRTIVTRPATNLYTVQNGQTFRVRMNETISSKTARVGDRFTTTVTEPVYSNNGVVVIPVGTTITPVFE